MLKRPQIAGTYAFKCALLFLASAVFTWGLQAKLSLYKPPQSPSSVTVAKLLTERRSAQTIDSLKRIPQSDTAWETLNLIPLLVLVQAILFITFELCQVGMDLCRSRRWDFQAPHLTQRPPPAF
jgi:short subunit fatty acids transporter